MLLLVISSNFFYYSFANNEESFDGSEFDFINIEQNEELIVNNLDSPGLLESPNDETDEEIKDNSGINAILDTKEFSSVFSEEIEWDEKPIDNPNISPVNHNISLYPEWQSELENSNQEENELNSNEILEKALNNEDKWDENYSCNECSICYDINEDPDEDFCMFCLLECDEEEWDDIFDEEDLPNLIISEVFFGWTNERIEIYNMWNDFGWNLEFSWAARGVRTISNVFIPAWSTIIIWNAWASNVVSWIPVMWLDSSSFSISDDKEFQIKLIYSWIILDTFQALANKKKNTTSFQRFVDSKNIVETTLDFVQNVHEWFNANPWIVYDEPEGWGDPNEPENPDEPENPEFTWSSESAPNLVITEIYFDWDDNWFEITNIWNNVFSWDLTLNWNLNFTISTQISSWVSKVFANSLAMFENSENIEIISNNVLFNNEQINLNLIRSGEILDTFYVHESRVDYLQEYETSFEKVWHWTNWITTYVWLNFDRIYNTNRWIAANPTTYFTQWENMKDVTKDRNWTEIYTGDNYILPIDCDGFQNNYTATISEVYYRNNTYPSYVELKIDENISDYSQIFLSGSAVSSPVYFNTRWIKKNTFVLLTNNSTRYDEWRESKWNSNFSLNSSWWLILYWVDSYWEDILDVVYIAKSSAWNSVYMWNKFLNCAGVFDYSDKFSPWLTIWQSQFIQITPDPIIQYIQVWWWGWSCSNNETPTFDSSSFSSSEIQISAIKYYGGKQILKLKNKTNSDINLREYYLQFLDWSTKNLQWNTLFAKATMSFVWNYWLQTNQDFCVNLMKDWEVIDRYCRNSLTKATIQDEENIANQLTFWENLSSEEWDEEENISDEPEILSNTWDTNENLFQTNLIKIIDIDYDPTWADWDNESVTLLLLTWNYVDLSGYNIYYTKDGKTQKAKAKIQWILSYWIRQSFKWWFAFPNSTDDKKPVTVNLIWPDNKVVDTYIYNPNKITEIPAGDYEVVSVIDGDTIKINYDSQEFTIRFAWIDAPESSALRCGKVECFWPEAKQYLRSLIEWKTINFEPASTDWYDRFIWYIYLWWESINEKLIKNWYAREYSYKNQSYKYQSQFKYAQDYARNNSLWLRWYECKWERLCPVDETQMEYNFLFNIENIIYDPEWDDNGKEEIWLRMIDWVTTEFGTDFYLLVNDTKKSLKKYGSISPLETKKLVWTFWFPNNRLTTVSLVHNWEILDTYVYNPELDKIVDTGSTLSTWDEILAKISQFQILSILPNPFWADWSNEEIELFCKSELPKLNLSSWFYLQIWTTKKYLKWEISTNENVNLKWAFSFPNKWWCVELGYQWFIFDKFCYTQPDEWQKFQISNWVIESISTLDLSILKNSKLQNIWNKVCLTYAGQKFACKNMPYSKLSTKRISQNKMYKSFFDSFEDYMKDNWKIMYYDSEIKNYFELLDEIEDVISAWWSKITIDSIQYDISDFENMYNAKYKKSPSKSFGDLLRFLFSNEIVDKYESLKSEYIEYLSNI